MSWVPRTSNVHRFPLRITVTRNGWTVCFIVVMC